MPTEPDYMAWLKSGDQRGITWFFDTRYVSLCYYAESIIEDKEVAKEIVGDAFVNVWKRGEIFETANGVVIYLTKAVRNRCRNYLKSKKRREKGLKDLPGPDMDETVMINTQIRAELFDEIKKEMDTLSGRLREILHLRMEGLSVQEIAGQLGINVQTVRSHLHRLRQLIYEKIKNRY